jgi:hypothetical protein
MEAFIVFGGRQATITDVGLSRTCNVRPEWASNGGDGTVPVASAAALDTEIRYFEGRRYGFAVEHLDLVRRDEVRRCVLGLLQPTPSCATASRAALYGRAVEGPGTVELKLTDVSGGIYAQDDSGNTSGALPDETRSLEIPGSDFEMAGQTQFLVLPADEPFTAYIWAEEAGEGHLRLRLRQGDAATMELHYLFSLQAGGKARLRFEGAGAGVPVLEVDADGDGSYEQQVEALELPIANAGESQEVRKGETVTLDGTASLDRLGRPLSYEWRQIGGPAVALSAPTAPNPQFVAPVVSEDTTLTFALTVTAGGTPSRADLVNVLVRACGAEICNGRDDDCDGEVDEEDPEVGRDCDTKLGGVCGPGTLQCDNGRLLCVPVESGCAVTECPDDHFCDDGLFCNGRERCQDGMCLPGEAPCTDACQTCDEETDSCKPIEGCQSPCPGDCNNDGEVTIDELIRMVNVALGSAELSSCRSGDLNGDSEITIDEIIRSVNVALNGCPS